VVVPLFIVAELVVHHRRSGPAIANMARWPNVTCAAATLAPVVPLALTMMSLEELLKTLGGVLF
jgi:hypothetical protein